MENKQLLLRNETNIYIKKKKKPQKEKPKILQKSQVIAD